MRGRRHSRDRRNLRALETRIELPPDAAYRLHDVAWDTNVLRLQMRLALAHHGVPVADLVRAWDLSGSGQLSRALFVGRVQDVFGICTDGHGAPGSALDILWSEELRPLATLVFNSLSTGTGAGTGGTSADPTANVSADAVLAVASLERWLSEVSDEDCARAKDRPPPLKADRALRKVTRGLSSTSLLRARAEAKLQKSSRAQREARRVEEGIEKARDRLASRRLLTDMLRQCAATAEAGVELTRWESDAVDESRSRSRTTQATITVGDAIVDAGTLSDHADAALALPSRSPFVANGRIRLEMPYEQLAVRNRILEDTDTMGADLELQELSADSQHKPTRRLPPPPATYSKRRMESLARPRRIEIVESDGLGGVFRRTLSLPAL